jgi:hypothetical protein
MSPKHAPTETMTAEEQFKAVASLKDQLEENFIQLGQLLSEIKRGKAFLRKGYKTFKDFVETEYSLSSSLAGKLVQVFDVFIEEMDIDEGAVKQIGFDKLSMIKPMVDKADWTERDEWVQKAEEMPTGELRDHIKEVKKQLKEEELDPKKVYIDQYLERMLSIFNCSRSELNFKLALYFQDVDPDEMKIRVKERQRRFESDIQKEDLT